MAEDVRTALGAALNGMLSEEQLTVLVTEVLAVTKQGKGWCPSCRRHVVVDVPDARAVTAALVELSNQAWGRPDVAAESTGIVSFVREVVSPGAEEPLRAAAGAVGVSGEQG
jgi:hypothetical protein